MSRLREQTLGLTYNTEHEDYLPRPPKDAQELWYQYYSMVESGIDNISQVELRQFYAAVVAFQTYHSTVAGLAKSRYVKIEHLVKKAYAKAFIATTGTGEVRKQTAFQDPSYTSFAEVYDDYKSNEAFHQGLADGMAGIASFISREFTARQMEMAERSS